MNSDKLTMSTQQTEQIMTMLKSQGLSESEINEILNGEYSSFQSEHDLANLFSSDGNYQNVLRGLADGYTLEELPQIGVQQGEVQDFLGMINKCNLSVENAKAINQYSNGSNMILSIKKGNTTREDIQGRVKTDMFEKLKTRGMSEEQIQEIQKFIDTLDLESPVHDNYEAVRDYADKIGIQKSCYPSMCSAVKDMDRLKHIDSTIESLDEGLSKSRLPESMKLYRAIKTNGQRQPEDYQGKSMSNNGYTSTSPLYDSSFAKYDEYDTVMEIYAPKGTQGSYMTQLSDYDTAEQEVLLNPNDIYIINAQNGVIDQNGRTKTVVRGLLLSKDRECYKGIDKKRETPYVENQTQKYEDRTSDNYTQSIQETNLPARQGRFSSFFNKVRAKFTKMPKERTSEVQPQEQQKSNSSYANTTEQTSQKKCGFPRFQDLSPEEQQETLRTTAEICEKHVEQSQQQEQQLQQSQQNQDMNNGQMQGQIPQQPQIDMGGMEL